MFAAAACLGLGLFLAWAVNDFTWSSRAPARVAAKPVHVLGRVHREAKAKPARRVHSEAKAKPTRRVRPARHVRAPTVTLVAARGTAWVSVRAGSPAGRTLYEGLLPWRRRLTFGAPRLALRVQGGGNLDAVLAGRRIALGRYDLRQLAVTSKGIRVLSGVEPPAVVAS